MNPTLIQIHYHLRTGGVTTVIRRYAETFVKLTNCNSSSFVFCNDEVSSGDDYLKIIHLNECDYKKYTDEADFITNRKKIESALEMCFNEKLEKGPVVVIAHNLALGKNLALTSAFYNCSKKYLQKDICFFCALHDFAEEGRLNELDAIRNVERFQSDIRKQMYCINAPIKIIVPNKSLMYLLSNLGFDVTTVANPVNCEQLNVDKCEVDGLRKRILYNAHKQCLPFDENKQLAYYPVRLIPRKNIYEAILVSCIFFNSLLITGPSGNSPNDVLRFRKLDGFVKKNRLPVMTDVITGCDLQNRKMLIETLMLAADYIVSTSVAEGFGYALFEPWIQHKMLIGRKITGYIMPEGWDHDSMYSFLPVPVKWIDINRVRKEYDTYYIQCFGEKKSWSFEKKIVHGNFIDFASLSEYDQMSIIETVLNDRCRYNEWLKILEQSFNGWPGLHNVYNSAKRSIENHSKIVRTEFNEITFNKTFSEVFLKCKLNRVQQADYHKIENHFKSPDFFRLLPGRQVLYNHDM